MNFGVLCDQFETIRSTKGPTDKKRLLHSFMKHLRENFPNDTYSTLRLMVPQLDRERPAFRIKELKISRLVIKMLGLPESNDKTVLLRAAKAGSTREFADNTFSILKKYVRGKRTSLTVEQLNAYLDKIANRTSDQHLDDTILEIIRKLTAVDTKWFIHILLKSPKLGVGDDTILKAYHVDAQDFYSANSNIKTLCEKLSNPSVRLCEMSLNTFEAFRPMLSKRAEGPSFRRCFPENQMFIVENKFDGERFQIHYSGGEFRLFSRRSFDYTQTFETLTDKLKQGPPFDGSVDRVILDGEMMLWHVQRKKFGSKGMNLDVKKLVNVTDYVQCFCAFDVLLLNDRVLTGLPLIKRKEILARVIQEIPGALTLSQHKEVTTRQQILDALNESMDRCDEGIVVKHPDSLYKFGDRNGGWYKIKMEYFDEGVQDLDVLLIGGSYTTLKRIHSFHVGIKSNDSYISLGQISSGLSDHQVDYLNRKFQDRGRGVEELKGQSVVVFGRLLPDLWLEPQDSCVLTVRASELERTSDDSVKTPYTLRFPRVREIREDKPPEECMSINELLELTRHSTSVIKLNKRHLDMNDVAPGKKSTKRAKLEMVHVDSNHNCGTYLSGKRFYVAPSEVEDLDDIYLRIRRAGGDISYKIDDDEVDIVLLNSASHLPTSPRQDLVKLDWLRRVLKHAILLPYEPGDLIRGGISYKSDLMDKVDRFGDSYTEQCTKESLNALFDRMSKNNHFLNVNRHLTLPSHHFAHLTAYFDSYEIVNDPNSAEIYYSFPDKMHFRYFNGRVSDQIDAGVNIVITGTTEREMFARDFLRRGGSSEGQIKVVTRDFLYL